MIAWYEDTIDHDEPILRDFEEREPPLMLRGTKVKMNDNLKRASLKSSLT